MIAAERRFERVIRELIFDGNLLVDHPCEVMIDFFVHCVRNSLSEGKHRSACFLPLCRDKR